jgi:uncharacterized membrane protein SirB2
MFLALKGLHMMTMALSIIMFITRGTMLIRLSPRLDDKFIRSAPNIIDGLLIISALGAAITIGWYPFANAWVTAKLLGTLVYLGLTHAGYHTRKPLIHNLAVIPLIYVLATVACHSPIACFGDP